MTRSLGVAGKVANRIAWGALPLTDRAERPGAIHTRSVADSRLPEAIWRPTSPAVIEPSLGYVIVEPSTLSMNGFDALRGRLPPWTYGIPSAAQWLSRRRARDRT